MKFNPQFDGLKRKTKTAFEIGFRFSEIVKLTMEIESSLSIMNKC